MWGRAPIRVVVCILILVSVIFETGCDPKPKEASSEVAYNKYLICDLNNLEYPGSAEQFGEAPTSQMINISVFFDATSSMRGFVNLDYPGEYENSLQKLERVIINAFDNYNEEIGFYKFWEKPIEISKEEYRKDLFNPNFYGGNQIEGNDKADTNLINCITAMSNELAKSPDNSIALMVTDFVSTMESDRVDFINNVYEKIINNGYAFGIIGFQSEFNGTVYDIVTAGRSQNFKYKGNRPCYIIVIGKPSDVNAFISGYDAVIGNALPQGSYHTYMLSEAGLKPNQKAQTDVDISISDDYSQLMIPATADTFLGASISENIRQQAHCYDIFEQMMTLCPDHLSPAGTITFDIPYAVEDYANISLKEWKINHKVNMVSGEAVDLASGTPLRLIVKEQLGEDQAQNANADGPKFFEDGGNLVVIDDIKCVKDSVEVQFHINMKELELGMPYALSLNIDGTPVLEGTELPGWISDWTMNMSHFDSWMKDNNTFEGNTTPYLLDTVELLRTRVSKTFEQPQSMEIGQVLIAFKTNQFKGTSTLLEMDKYAKELQGDIDQ